jgi:hypothetical protein
MVGCKKHRPNTNLWHLPKIETDQSHGFETLGTLLLRETPQKRDGHEKNIGAHRFFR